MLLGSFSSCMMMPMGNNNNVSSSSPKKNSSSKKNSSKEDEDDEDDDSSLDDESEYTFQEVLSKQAGKSLKADETVTYDIDEDISGKNYIKLEYQTDVHLYGVYTYANAENPSQVVEEEFFIEAGTSVFKQFLDSYRKNAIGAFDKILKKISLTNKSGTAGEITLASVAVSDRSIPEMERELYVVKDGLKVGADLAAGGALTYLGREYYQTKDGKRETIDEVIDKDNNVYIGVGLKKEDYTTLLSSSVNLINVYDLGREFQQSYYAEVGGGTDNPNGANGYTRGFCDTTGKGYYWPYNPVQAGDCAHNPSQIIDYEITESLIWIKVRPMDWSKGDTGRGFPNTLVGGETTKSYMENRYIINNGVVFVENSFIDWNGFYDLESTIPCTNELPAAYIVHPLRNYVCYTKDRPWINDKLDVNSDLGFWENAHFDITHPEDWFAWVNDEMFGVGVYAPNMGTFASGSLFDSSNVNGTGNSGAQDSPYITSLLGNKAKPTSTYTSCYVGNTNYTAPFKHWRLKEYEKRSYEYAISVDYVDVMRAQFKEICDSGKLTNASMDTWCD